MKPKFRKVVPGKYEVELDGKHIGWVEGMGDKNMVWRAISTTLHDTRYEAARALVRRTQS